MYFWMGLPKYVFNKNADFALEHWHCSTADLIPDTSLPEHLSIVSLAQMSGTVQNQDSCAQWVTARSWLTPPSERPLVSVQQALMFPWDVSTGQHLWRTLLPTTPLVSLQDGLSSFQGKNLCCSLFWTVPTHQVPQQGLPEIKRPWKLQPTVFTSGSVMMAFHHCHM